MSGKVRVEAPVDWSRLGQSILTVTVSGKITPDSLFTSAHLQRPGGIYSDPTVNSSPVESIAYAMTGIVLRPRLISVAFSLIPFMGVLICGQDQVSTSALQFSQAFKFFIQHQAGRYDIVSVSLPRFLQDQ